MKKGYDVFVSDMGMIKEHYKNMLNAHGIEWEEGQHTASRILDADEVIKSPGIPDNAPMVVEAINRDILKLAIPSILANITVPIVGMVDIAVAGHLDTNAAVMIGGIAIGTMLFDLLYWNFGFLRVGTGGLTAQAYGKGDMKECSKVFTRAVGIALACAMVLIAIQWIFVKAAFLVVDCTPEVRELASGPDICLFRTRSGRLWTAASSGSLG